MLLLTSGPPTTSFRKTSCKVASPACLRQAALCARGRSTRFVKTCESTAPCGNLQRVCCHSRQSLKGARVRAAPSSSPELGKCVCPHCRMGQLVRDTGCLISVRELAACSPGSCGQPPPDGPGPTARGYDRARPPAL